MVGASLALLLARALPQKQIVLLEAKPLAPPHEQPTQPSFDDRTTALSPSSAHWFDELGVWEALEPQATAIDHIHVSDRGHFGAAQFGPQDNKGKPLGYVVPNLYIGRSLLARVQQEKAIRLLAPVEVQRLTPVRGGMQVQFADAKDLRAELVVLADGAGSPLAAGLGVGSRIKDYGQCALIANVAYEQPHRNRAFERFTDEGPLALLPLNGHSPNPCESALIWTLPAARLTEAQSWNDQQFLQELQQSFGYRLGHFQRVGSRSVYPLSLQLAEEQVRSSLVLMGNAAHSLHPVAGQGFNLALRDCARLTQVLAAGKEQALGSLTLLQNYEREQERDQMMTVGLSDSFIRIFATGQPAVVAGRNLGLLSLELISGWRSSFLTQMAGRSQPRARLGL